MNKRLIVILFIITLIIFGFTIEVLSCGYNGIIDDSSKNNSNYTPIFISMYLPIFIILMSLQTPQHPVEQSIYILANKKYDKEKKKRKVDQFVSEEFKNTIEYDELFDLKFVRFKKVIVENKKSDNPTVNVILKDFSKYTFNVIKRNKKIDPKGSSKWVIIDYKKQLS